MLQANRARTDRPSAIEQSGRNGTVRHNILRDLLCRLLQTAGFRALAEQEEGALRHRPDVRVEAGLAPVLTYLDVSVFTPQRRARLIRSKPATGTLPAALMLRPRPTALWRRA